MGTSQRWAVIITAIWIAVSTAVSAWSAEDARVLPKGRSRFSVIYGQTAGISDTFNSNGTVEPITAAYSNIALSAMNLQGLASDISQLTNLLNSAPYLRFDESQRNTANHGVVVSDDPNLPKLADVLTRGILDVGAEGVRKQYNFAYQYGVTDQLSVGMMVPYIQMDVNVNYGIFGDNTANDMYLGLSGIMGSGPMTDGLNQLRNLSTQSLQNQLTSMGYQPFQDYHGKGLGDVVVGARYNYLLTRTRGAEGKRDEWINSVQLGTTIPTGKVKDPSELTAVDFGQGAWDIGAAHIVNYNPSRRVTLTSGQHYTHRLPASRELWVRNSPSEFAPNSSEAENVSMQLGDKIWTNAGAKVCFSDVLSVETSYEWYWKLKDTYQGSQAKDYTYLSDQTDSYTETLQIGGTVSSIAPFLRKQFLLPGELNLNYYWPTRGRNSIIAPYGTVELALYF